ncbi:ABC-2 family transporter protein [Ruminiclostridium hungatei]|uniref:ABC-2 family transporter protein n=1 Tax=Ruminiclostridium hungatei TaxID=48256 RepID=A0A1V4SSR5_RUMHU|nr:ABC transporter permease subunit [Ruminiclostridium hungatei]OPX46287.1 ABC-2 family transporter protein [Ruminiclostridium hungatei]
MLLYKREIIRNGKSTMLWTAILLLYNISMLLLYPSMTGAMKDKMNLMLQAFPKEMIIAMGLDKVSITELLGFYNTYCYLLVTILGGIFAMLQGISVLSKEEDEKTIEFLLSKPITRNRIIFEKVSAVLTNILILNIVVSMISYVAIELVSSEAYSLKALLLLFLGPVLMQVTFAAVGLLISIFIVKARINIPVGVGIVLGLYFISILATVSEKADFLKYVTPFKYVDGADIINSKAIEPVYLAIMTAVTLACTFITRLIYNKKDIVA